MAFAFPRSALCVCFFGIFVHFHLPSFPRLQNFTSILRLKKEIKECNRDVGISGVSVEVLESQTHMRGTLKGPIDTPYEGGVFMVDIKIPDNYPFEYDHSFFLMLLLIMALDLRK